jgi:hypothetical protein
MQHTSERRKSLQHNERRGWDSNPRVLSDASFQDVLDGCPLGVSFPESSVRKGFPGSRAGGVSASVPPNTGTGITEVITGPIRWYSEDELAEITQDMFIGGLIIGAIFAAGVALILGRMV